MHSHPSRTQVKKQVLTRHKSTIMQIVVLKSGNTYSFSTCGLDGAIHTFTPADMVLSE